MSQRPGSFVNAAGILASDTPADVVRKLDAAWLVDECRNCLSDAGHLATAQALNLKVSVVVERFEPPAVPTCQTPRGDSCTESNCKRCRTHPNHRGDMEHAGIGWRPGDDNA